MDYKAHFEKFVSDIYKRFDEDDEHRRSFNEITENYKRTQQKLTEIVEALNKPVMDKPIDIIDDGPFTQRKSKNRLLFIKIGSTTTFLHLFAPSSFAE